MKHYRVWVDGYSIGDATLEGVNFSAVVSSDNKETNVVDVSVDPLDEEYFSSLNSTLWLELVGEYVYTMFEDDSLDAFLNISEVDYQDV